MNLPLIKKLLLLAAILIIHFTPASAQMKLILEHRAWADSVYADPGSMPEQEQIRHATLILVSNSQEESGFALLDTLGARIPELRDYVAFQHTHLPDTLTRHTLGAMGALADYAEMNYPGTITAYETRARYLYNCATVMNVADELDDFADRMEKEAGDKADREIRATICSARACALENRMNNSDADDTAHYAAIFKLEKEALEIYPIESEEITLARGDLYQSLAFILNRMENDQVAFIESGSGPKEFPNSYLLSGYHRLYSNRTYQYLEKSYEVFARALTPGHPIAQVCKFNVLDFKTGYSSPDEATIEDLEYTYGYFSTYYPREAIQSVSARVDSHIKAVYLGIDDPNGIFIESLLRDLETIYGPGNSAVMHQYYTVALVHTMVYPEDDYWRVKYLEKCNEAGHGPMSMKATQFRADLCNNFYDLWGPEAIALMNEITDWYMANHTPTNESYQLAASLIFYYTALNPNFSQLDNIYAVAVSDLRKQSQQNKVYNLATWALRIQWGNRKYENDTRNGEEYFVGLSKALAGEDFPQKPYVEYLLKSNWADSKTLSYDFEGSRLLLLDCLEFIDYFPDQFIKLTGMLAFACRSLQKADEKTNAYVERAIRFTDEIMASGFSGQLHHGSLSPLEMFLSSENRYEEALKLQQYCVEIYEKSFINLHTYDYIHLKQELGHLYESTNRLNEAFKTYDEAYDLMKETYKGNPSPFLLDCLWEDYSFTKDHTAGLSWDLVDKLMMLANATSHLIFLSGNDPNIVYTYGADAYAEVLIVYQNIIQLMQQGIDNPELMSEAQYASLSRQLEQSKQDYAQSSPIALQIWEGFKANDKDYIHNPHYPHLNFAIASHYAWFEKDTVRAMEIRAEVIDGIINPAVKFHTVTGVAWDYYNIGHPQEARKYLMMARDCMPDINMVSDETFMNFNNLSFQLALDNKEYAEALPYARNLFARHKETLDRNFRFMTADQQNNYLNRYGDPAASLARLLEYLPDAYNGEIYDAIVYRTGMQLRSQRAAREAIEKSGDENVMKMVEELGESSRRLEGLEQIINGITSDDENFKLLAQQFNELKLEINRLEQKIIDATAAYQPEDVSDVRWTQIRDRLESNEMALEYLFSDKHIMALVLRKDYDRPRVITMGLQSELWDKVHPTQANNSAALAKYLYDNPSNGLYEMLWQPLEQEMQGVERVYFSAPGVLNSLAFNAFSTPDGGTLFDKYDLVQLTTTAQLVFDHPQKKPQTIAMMGDILYSPDQKPRSIADPGARDVDTDFSFDDFADTDDERKVAYSAFRHLPFTALEIDRIATLFDGENIDSERRLEATEQRLRRMVEKSPDILHLATHGYYVAEDPKKLEKHPFFRKKGIGAMQRSGIALSGAEKTWKGISEMPDDNDGIVTAAEVASMNMGNTGLVALSACETALGDFNFEGIFGLQRGFKQAGVHSLLVSLWSVNDDSTSLFMTTFYENLISGENRQKSWRKAVEKVREKYPSPYFWAPFILLDGI